jgi:hypothetical protein
MLVLLDVGFFLFHTLLIGFNVVGWAWPRTRVLHLLTMGATTFSWFVLGATYGWGYCLCTDWHFQVRQELGYHDPESTYVQLLVHQLFGVSLSVEAANWIAGGVFAFIVVATAVTWARVGWRRWRSAVRKPVGAS